MQYSRAQYHLRYAGVGDVRLLNVHSYDVVFTLDYFLDPNADLREVRVVVLTEPQSFAHVNVYSMLFLHVLSESLHLWLIHAVPVALSVS